MGKIATIVLVAILGMLLGKFGLKFLFWNMESNRLWSIRANTERCEDTTKSCATFIYAAKQRCNEGEVEACIAIGAHYGYKDFMIAKVYYEKACDLGDSISCNDIASLYEKGKGVPIDMEKAKEYYAKACDFGDYYMCNKYREKFNKKEYNNADDEQFYIE